MNSSSDDLEFFDDLALGDNDGDVQMQDAAPQTMLHAVCYDADNALIELRSLDDATMQLWRKGKPISASFTGRPNPFLGESVACLDNGNIAVSTQGVRVFGQTGEQFEQIANSNFSTVDTVCSDNGSLYGVTRDGDVIIWRNANRTEHTVRPIFSRGNPQVYGHSCWQGQLPFVVDSAKGGSNIFLVNVETRQKQGIGSSNPPNKIHTAYITQRGLLFLVSNNTCTSICDMRDKKIIATLNAVDASTECRLKLYPPKNMSVYWALMCNDFAKRTAQLWDLRCMREPVCQKDVRGTLTRTGDLSLDGSRLTYVGYPWDNPCTIDFGSSYFAHEHNTKSVLTALGKRALGTRK